ncbi:MAG: Ppx/GppA phosphatase family protein [Rhizobiaceae bacterium]|nr:Ppx/GppA phosphatase family protein [Rhizobiaceae bacterium]
MSDLSNGAEAPGGEQDPNSKGKRSKGRRRRRQNAHQNRKGAATVKASQPSHVSDAGHGNHGGGNRSGSQNPSNYGNRSGVQPNGKHAHYPQRRNDRSHHQRPLYAALDLGTNNCRLLIACPQKPGRFRVVDGFSRIVRLGEGLAGTGRLSEQAMDRAVEALKICSDKLRNRKIKAQRLIATEACRRADNGEEFLSRVKEETGLDLEIVTQEMEARLAAAGCGALMDRKSNGAVLFDIGGGSSELVLVDRSNGRRRNIAENIAGWTSLPLGVVTLAEQFGGQDVTRELFDEMVESVMEKLESFSERRAIDHLFASGDAHLLGTSGTVTTLAGIHLELPKYDRRQVDGIWLTSKQVDTIIDRLLGMTYEERAANPCVGTERADLVLAGCAILNAIRNVWPAEMLRVADRGLREGLLTDMMHRDRSWVRPRKGRWSRKRRKKRDQAHSGSGETS